MKKLFVLLASLPMLLFSQVYDDFSDGDLTKNPTWSAQPPVFIVNDDFQLQLHDASENQSWITTYSVFPDQAEWRCWIKLGFSPSSNNQARFYLISDQTDLSGPLNGYFIQLGESGSDDALELFKQEGDEVISICRGQDGLISSSIEMGIKVTREDAHWRVYADPYGGTAFMLQAEGDDENEITGGYLGFFCKYTKSNASKMYFDEVYAGALEKDIKPPNVHAVHPESDSTLKVLFDEPVDPVDASQSTNYEISGGIGNPIETQVKQSLEEVLLIFGKHFMSGERYSISVSGITDLAGNEMQPAEQLFLFYTPQLFDVVINEIMADPTPGVGLPEFEYIELFNRTDVSIDLNGWTLGIGEQERTFLKASLEARGFLIVGHEDAQIEFQQYGIFYGFSSFSLKNSGQRIELFDKNGISISTADYNLDWYQDDEKAAGGWSLEKINPEDVCAKSSNWISTSDPDGGTPGETNSRNASKLSAPEVAYFEVADDQSLMIRFSHEMNPLHIGRPELFETDRGIGMPSMVKTSQESNDLVELYFQYQFQEETLYQLVISAKVENCAGITMRNDTTILFGLPVAIDSGDIIINEILFNPLADGSDYVEIYNRSGKVIDLSALALGTVKGNPPDHKDTMYYEVISNQKLMLPEAYLVLTKSPEAVKNQFTVQKSSSLVAQDPFPAYNNDEGICLLSTSRGKVVDAFSYSEEMHYPLLVYQKGVSLERISFNEATNEPSNWHSASALAGFGTPGYKNSQHISHEEIHHEIQIEPEVFSPDNDGYDDVLSINYRFDQPGNAMIVDIFSSNGHLVRRLVNNQYVGTSGSFCWDGITEHNTKAPVGIYILFIRTWDMKGEINTYKRTCVLASKL